MSNRSTNKALEHEQFTENCLYLGLKLLSEQYTQMVDQAGKNDVGYYQFISDIIQAEALAKQQRRDRKSVV